MKKLQNILANVAVLKTVGNINISVDSIQFDSRKISKDSLFIATRGTQVDGHNYISKAIDLGATAILCENIPSETPENICFIKVENSQTALGLVASAW